MIKIPFYCENPECSECEKYGDVCCWNDCDDKTCQNMCRMARYAYEVYADDSKLVKELHDMAVDMDNWLASVAAVKIEELTERILDLEEVDKDA